MTNDSNTVRKDVSLEIALTEYRGKVYGYSCSEFIINDTLYYIVKRVKGTIDGDKCEVKDDEILSYNFHGKLDKGVKVVHTFLMNKQDSTWSLEGGWKTTSTKKYYSLSGKTDLKEEKDLTNSKLFPHLEELKLSDDVAFYKEQKRLKEAAVQTTTTENDVAKNLSINKPAINTKNNPSLASVENNEEKKTEPVEEKFIIQQKKVDGSVATIPSETKKTSLSSVNTVEAKKPIVIDAGKPFIEKKETQPVIVNADTKKTTSTIQSQPEIRKNETSPAIVQNETKKNVPVTANNVPIKKNEPVVASNNNFVQKNEVVSNPVQTAPKKIETPVTTISADISKTNVQTNIVNTNKLDPNFATAAVFANKRKSEKMRTINYKSDSLELVLYDNGEIDGDTVSVLLNNEVIIAKQCLKAVAYKQTIYIPKSLDDSTVLTLYAENLGKYPPNTGLLIIHDGDDDYKLYFTTDLQTNAAVVLRRKK